ncbi:MAG: hypothetical protein AB7M93_18155 [Candidatus Obscuribacterales bacterium]
MRGRGSKIEDFGLLLITGSVAIPVVLAVVVVRVSRIRIGIGAIVLGAGTFFCSFAVIAFCLLQGSYAGAVAMSWGKYFGF